MNKFFRKTTMFVLVLGLCCPIHIAVAGETDAPDTAAPAAEITETVAPTKSKAKAEGGEAANTSTAAPTAEPTPTVAPTPTSTPTPSAAHTPTAAPTPTPTAAQSEAPPTQGTTAPSQSPAQSVEPVVTQESELAPEASATEGLPVIFNLEVKTIAAFAPLTQPKVIAAQKPDDAGALFPSTLGVTLDDLSQDTVPVTWSCPDYNDVKESYIFTAAINDANYALAEGVKCPEMELVIEPEVVTIGDFVCQKDADGFWTILQYKGSASTLNIPAELDGAKVRAVAENALKDCRSLTEVALSDGIVSLGAGAFDGCTALKKLLLPDSLEAIGSGIFGGMAAPETIQLAVFGETMMNGAGRYAHQAYDQDNREYTANVSADFEFTDFAVQSGGIFTIAAPLTVAPGHALQIVSGGTGALSSGIRLIINGAMSAEGAFQNGGEIYACGGTLSGVENGTIHLEHSWSGAVCTICGATRTIDIGVRHATGKIAKTYDGTSGLDFNTEDFVLEGVESGADVRLAAINTSFADVNVGNYLATLSFELAGADAAKYHALDDELEVQITPKAVTVTPHEDQGKVYGDADPTLRASYRGVVSGETLSGKLGRESGENVGKYKITVGTLKDRNPNYTINLAEAHFTISAKLISDKSVTTVKIPNQKYTGAALKPEVEVRDGLRKLAEGKDYTLAYSDNTEVGTALVTIEGKGNYKGTRTASFLIIRVTPGGSGTGMGTASSFPDGEPGDYPQDIEYVTNEDGHLTLPSGDFGTILFDADDNWRPFMQYELEPTVPEGGRILCLIAPPMQSAEGEPVVNADGEELFEPLQWRISMDLIAALRSEGYSELRFAVGEAEARVPLDTLYAEYVSVEKTLYVSGYVLSLCPVYPDQLEEYQKAALEGCEQVTTPYRFELTAVDKDGQTEDVLDLLDGVVLMLTPTQAPDYENEHYSIFCIDTKDEGYSPSSEDAELIMEDFQVKARILPTYSALISLIKAQE